MDGIRCGCTLCIEANFPEVFAEYERMDVDCVLLSVMVDDAPRARVAQAYGTLHNYWLGYSVPVQFSTTAPSGIVAPGGRWPARCPASGRPALAIADIDLDSQDRDIDIAVRYTRPWRRIARAGLYDERIPVGDPRSDHPHCFLSGRPPVSSVVGGRAARHYRQSSSSSLGRGRTRMWR